MSPLGNKGSEGRPAHAGSGGQPGEKAPGQKSWLRRNWSTLLLLVALVVGVGLLLYPTVSDWWNSRHMSQVVAEYDEAVAALSEEDYSEAWAAAEAYNEELAELGSLSALSDPDLLEGYEDLLDVTGTGIMGYVTIDKLGIELPIYHGTSDSVLSAGAGHLEGSSLPIGGSSTHSVISAHRGLPSATLFTNLDQMEVGDTFTVTVLGETLTYEVDLISIVDPDELEALYVEDGQDYCTLLTCTPYGINTQRLLVRGHRVENASDELVVTAEATKISSMTVAAVVATPMLVILLIWLLASTRRRDRREASKK